MRRDELIKKTLEKKKGYKLRSYETNYVDDVLYLYHYGTEILRVDIKNKKILNYLITSVSDSDMIRIALDECELRDYYVSRDNIYRIVEVTINNTKMRLSIKCEHEDEISKIVNVLSKLNDDELETIDRMNCISIANICELILNEDEMTAIKEIRKRVKRVSKLLKYHDTINKLLESDYAIFKNAIMIRVEKQYYDRFYFVFFLDDKIYYKDELYYKMKRYISKFAVKREKLNVVETIEDVEDINKIADVIEKLNYYNKDTILKKLLLMKVKAC